MKDDVYLIVSPLSQQAIDNSGDKEKEQSVIQWSSDPSNGNQHWKVTQLPNGNYVFTCQANGYNMGFPDAGLVGEPIFQLKPDAGPERHQWVLVKSDVKIKVEPLKTHSDNEWENQHVFAINKEDGHAIFIPFANAAEMKADPAYRRPWERTRSSRYQLLNGNWKFHWVKQPEERPKEFYKPGYDVSAWAEIPVRIARPAPGLSPQPALRPCRTEREEHGKKPWKSHEERFPAHLVARCPRKATETVRY